MAFLVAQSKNQDMRSRRVLHWPLGSTMVMRNGSMKLVPGWRSPEFTTNVTNNPDFSCFYITEAIGMHRDSIREKHAFCGDGMFKVKTDFVWAVLLI